MKTTLYVPCYNAERTLPAVLESVGAQTHPPDEVLVIDDGSTDATASVALASTVANLRTVRQKENLGLAAARNRALLEATGDILIGVDADVCLDQNYIANVTARLGADHELGAICGRLHERHVSDPADHWRAVHMKQEYGAEACENPRFLYGCTTSARRGVLESLGGWDERFRRAYEDVDLTERLRAAGVRTAYEPSCIAYHLRKDTIASVLTSFWHWFFPKSELAGHFDALDAWVSLRLPHGQWSLFRSRLAQDFAAGRDALLPISILMPWWMTAMDLMELGRRDQHQAERTTRILMALPHVAASVIEKGTGLRELASWIREAIANVMVAPRPRSTPMGLPDDATLEAIRHAAQASLTLSSNETKQLARTCRALPSVGHAAIVESVASRRTAPAADDPAENKVTALP